MKLIFENWRGFLEEKSENSIDELTLPFSSQNKMEKEIKKLEKEMSAEEHISAWDKIKQEARETKEAWHLIKTYFVRDLSQDEKTALWRQMKDLAKGTTLAAIFAAPGGTLLLPFVLKYLKSTLLPSAFANPLKEEIKDHKAKV